MNIDMDMNMSVGMTQGMTLQNKHIQSLGTNVAMVENMDMRMSMR